MQKTSNTFSVRKGFIAGSGSAISVRSIVQTVARINGALSFSADLRTKLSILVIGLVSMCILGITKQLARIWLHTSVAAEKISTIVFHTYVSMFLLKHSAGVRGATMSSRAPCS